MRIDEIYLRGLRIEYITLDLQFFAGEKTEKATPKKKKMHGKKDKLRRVKM